MALKNMFTDRNAKTLEQRVAILSPDIIEVGHKITKEVKYRPGGVVILGSHYNAICS